MTTTTTSNQKMSTVKQNWLEQNLPDGRKCWYNLVSGQTVWEEPSELVQSAATPIISTGTTRSTKNVPNWDIVSSWREMTATNGRKYYYNTVTKVSMWEMPPEYAEYLENLKDPSLMDRDKLEERFMTMLKEKGITARHTWEETLREVINHPHYKLIPTLSERKALFAQYQGRQKEVEREEARQRALQRKDNFRELLRQTREITTTTSWREIEELIKDNESYLALQDAPEVRIQLFEDYQLQLQREELDRRKAQRRTAQEKLAKLLVDRSDVFIPDLPWRRARELMDELMQDDNEYAALDNLDKLTIYEDHIKTLERHRDELINQRRLGAKRKARYARINFRKLLEEIERGGHLTACTSWRELYPRICYRSEFQALVNQTEGSTPLDLFWDRLHQLQEAYICAAMPLVEELKSQDRLVGEWWNTLNPNQIPPLLHAHLLPQSPPPLPHQKEEIHARVDVFRRENRRLVDRLKQCIKHWQHPPITLDVAYEDIAADLAQHPDGIVIPEDFIRRYYFDKYIRHLKKKAGLLSADQKSDDD